MTLPDFEEFLDALNARGVRYLVGGAHALAFHARPRATKDLDVFVQPTRANAKRATLAVKDFFGGVAPKYVTEAHLCDEKVIVQLGVAPVRIDLLSHLRVPGGFSGAWRRRVEGRFGGVHAAFLSLDDLIAEKRHWDREQDRADLVQLERARRRLQSATAPKKRRSAKR